MVSKLSSPRYACVERSIRMRISVLIPAYNERATIMEVVRRVLEQPFDKELIIIDDASTDGTREILQQTAWPENIHVLYHKKNRGKGAALRTGIEQASGDIILIQD